MAKSNITIYTGALLIDGTGRDPIEDSLIVVEADDIAYAGKKEGQHGAAMASVDKSEVIDLTGKTVTPGFIDCHVHYGGCESPHDKDWALESDIKQAMVAIQQAQKSLNYGFTSVRDISGNGIHLRNLINSGHIVAPRIVACGKGLSRTGGHGDAYEVPLDRVETSHPWAVIADGEDEVRKAVRRLIKEGSDCIKLWATGGGLWEKERETDQHYSLAEIEVMVEEANYAGLPVCSHCESIEGAKDSIKAGVTSIEHGEELDDECIAMMRERGIYVVPTYGLFVDWFSEYEPPKREAQDLYPGETINQRELKRIAHNLKMIHEGGIKIAVGADSFSDELTPFGEYTHREIIALTEGGLSPMEAIVAATKTGSELLRIDSETGTLEQGKQADMLIFDSNPLEDITRINYSNIAHVIKGGEIIR